LSQWFDRQKAHLDVLESQLRGLVKAIDIVSRQHNGVSFYCLPLTWHILTRRAELASVVGEFAQIVSDLAASDLGQPLSQLLEALAELEHKAQETESSQARADQATLLSTADEYARLVNSVRVSMTALTIEYEHPRRFGSFLHRWRLVRVCECIMYGRTRMRSCAASSKHTSATAHKARSGLIVSGIHILKSARFVFLFRHGRYPLWVVRANLYIDGEARVGG
jgi:Vps5 C terminal like